MDDLTEIKERLSAIESLLQRPQEAPIPPIAVSVAKAADLMSVCAKSAYQMARMKDFPAVKVNGRLLVFVDGLREWVRKQAESTL